MTSPLTEQALRTEDRMDELGLVEPTPEVLDRLAVAGHARNGFCDACWSVAGDRAVADPTTSKTKHYADVVAEANAAAEKEDDMDKSLRPGDERDAEILRRAEAGESERAIARAVGVSRSTVWDVKQAAKKAARDMAAAIAPVR